MSQENVEVVRRAIDAWNRHDPDSGLRLLAADVEWLPASPAAVDSSVYVGHEEVRRGFEAIWDTWDEFRFEEKEVRDLGDAVLWLGTVQMRAVTSGIELSQEFANHLVLRAGQIVRAEAFLSWRQGLEAAGVPE
jgi:ketosteroid isomerase-like protein